MSPPQTGRPVVLIVDDEPIIRMNAAMMIEQAGYEAIEAGDADEAIVLLETREDIRIVVTDIEMPGTMDGIKLAKTIRNRWPPIELIITSGRYRVAKNDLPSRGKFLPKPYSFDVLATTMRTFVH